MPTPRRPARTPARTGNIRTNRPPLPPRQSATRQHAAQKMTSLHAAASLYFSRALSLTSMPSPGSDRQRGESIDDRFDRLRYQFQPHAPVALVGWPGNVLNEEIRQRWPPSAVRLPWRWGRRRAGRHGHIVSLSHRRDLTYAADACRMKVGAQNVHETFAQQILKHGRLVSLRARSRAESHYSPRSS